VSERGVVRQVVDADDLDVCARSADGAEEIPADTAETMIPTRTVTDVLLGWSVVLDLAGLGST
jgi:hypothetical protein